MVGARPSASLLPSYLHERVNLECSFEVHHAINLAGAHGLGVELDMLGEALHTAAQIIDLIFQPLLPLNLPARACACKHQNHGKTPYLSQRIVEDGQSQLLPTGQDAGLDQRPVGDDVRPQPAI